MTEILAQGAPTAAVAAEFATTVVNVRTRVDIYHYDTVTPWLLDADVLSGTVTADMTRPERRNLDIEFYDDGEMGYGPGNFWYDKVIRPYRGILLANGDEWLTPLGVFQPDTIKRPRFPSTITASCRDLAKRLQLDKFAASTTVAEGSNVGEVIQNTAAVGGIVNFAFQPTTKTLSSDVTFERDSTRWDACYDLATSLGFELFFDAFGHLVFRPYVDPLTAPVTMSFQTGSAGNLVEFTRSTTDSLMRNDIVIYGATQANALVFGRAENLDDASPTNINSVGRRTEPIPNQFIETDAEAQALAEAILAVSSLEQYDVNLQALALPWLEVGDAVEAILPDAAAVDPTRYLLSSLSIPLEVGTPMDVIAKRVTIVG